MKCMKCQFPATNPLSSKPRQMQHKQTLWLANKPGELTQSLSKSSSSVACGTKALPSVSAVFLATAESLAAAELPHGGNVSGLIKLSAFLLFAYWIANFVVPDFVLKDLNSRVKADQDPSEEDL